MAFQDLFKKKSVIAIGTFDEKTRDGLNKTYIPKYLYKPPFGYPRLADMNYARYLAQTSYVEMCISTIIDNIASIEWDIVPRDDLNETEIDDKEIAHIKNFLLNPNTNDESFEEVFIRMPVRDLLEINSGVLNKIYNRKGEMVEIVARDGMTFTKNPNIHGMFTNRDDIIEAKQILPDSDPLSNPWTEITASNARERAAYFQYGWITGPIPIPLGKKEIVWLERMKRTDDHYGMSPVQILAKNLQMLLYSIDSDLEYYNDNNVPKGIIGLDDSNADEMKAFRDYWTESQRTRDEFGNWKKIMNKVPIVNKVPTFTRIEFSSSEMQTIEKQKWYTKMVWACFGVTATELGYTEDASGAANQIVQSKVFKKKAINPILRLLEQKINKNIISEFGYFTETPLKNGTIKENKYQFTFKVKDLDDDKSKYELYKLQTETGIITINEIRKQEGLDPVDWGDEPFNINSYFPEQDDGFNPSETEEDIDIEPQGTEQEEVEEKSLDKKKNQKLQLELNQDEELKSQSSEEKAMTDNPLILKEGERPTGYKRLEKAFKYYIKQKEDEILKLISESNDTKPVLTQIKGSEQEYVQRIRDLLSPEQLKDILQKIIYNNYMEGWDKAEKDLNRNFIPDRDAINYIQGYTYDLVKDVNEDMINKLRQIFQRGFMNGKGANDLKKDIKEAIDIESNRYSMIARTETIRASNTGRLQGYQKSGIKGKKVYVATEDDRTSEICKRLDGQRVDLNEPFVDAKTGWSGMNPPAHVNCRSTWIFEPEFENNQA